jgi:hypothetical protein
MVLQHDSTNEPGMTEEDLRVVLDQDVKNHMVHRACEQVRAAAENLAILTGDKYAFLYCIENCLVPAHWAQHIPKTDGHMPLVEREILKKSLQAIWNNEVHCACCDHDGALSFQLEDAA